MSVMNKLQPVGLSEWHLLDVKSIIALKEKTVIDSSFPKRVCPAAIDKLGAHLEDLLGNMSQKLYRNNSNDRSLSSNSSTGSRSSQTSSNGDGDSLKWSEQSYSVGDILDKFRLPQIVRLHARGQPVHSSLPIPFNIAREQLLFFDSRNIRQLIAENLVDTSEPGSNMDSYLEDVVIPEDYPGLFVQPVTIGNSTELITYDNIESLVSHEAKGFLTLHTIQGIRKTSSLGSISQSNAGSCPKLYPRGSIFLIEEIQKWSFSSKGNLQNSHHAPSIMKVPSANRKSTVHFADSNQTNEYDSRENINQISKREGSSRTSSPLSPARKIPSIQRLSSSMNDNSLLSSSLKTRPVVRSASVGSSRSIDNGLVLKCKDASGRNVYFPFHTEGSFIEVLTHPTNPNKLSIQVKELLNMKVLPPMICFVYGKKRLLLTSGFLKLKEIQEHRSVVVCAVNRTSYVLFELPVTSNMKFSLSLNKNLLTSPHIQRALNLCEENATNFSSDIKVVTKLSSKSIEFGNNGLTTFGLETFKQLEDIAEVSSSEEEDDDEGTNKQFNRIPVEGVIYL
ncbi:uncharacterized protein LOC115214220 isoform X2 [Octopus sinensis]|uniref:Uncharacterized protein LOC115214220 isoform X2 n=1 Tax=Octopus sinensis TaxID=2607531 RepID=A0A7E6EYD6_9MOLL|nr:uncharacterized protein LOC115214220 isoform X2 [Octopus sinensis]